MEAGTSARWMLTYSDMVTLVLAFFIILFSFSTLDPKKFDVALVSLKDALGVMPESVAPVEERADEQQVPQTRESEPYTLDWSQLATMEDKLRESLQDLELEDAVVMSIEERGLVIRFSDRVLFDLGKADLKPTAREILHRVASVLKDIPNEIRVEGHTDDLPIHTERFPSNWELSTARATSVIRYFVESEGMDPYRLSAAGYGEYRPVAPNDSSENRQKNRRVDIVILHLAAQAGTAARRGQS